MGCCWWIVGLCVRYCMVDLLFFVYRVNVYIYCGVYFMVIFIGNLVVCSVFCVGGE